MIEYTVRVYGRVTEWWLNGKLHREDGPACEFANGSKFWYLNGKLHREDGPAIEWDNGTKEWWFNDFRHRGDGPAIEYVDSSRYYLNNIQYTEEEFNRKMNPVKELTVEEISNLLGYEVKIVKC